ncbi:MAG: four helix bundle protein [Thermoanaerobaculia bacterium]
MSKKKFEELVAFKRARPLVKEIYLISGMFPPLELYGLTSQMRRAAVSVLSQVWTVRRSSRWILGLWIRRPMMHCAHESLP